MSRSLALRLAVLAGLWMAVAGTAVQAVQARHEARRLFVELERLNVRRDELNIEWNRLRLEQSAWATHARVESLARDKLNLRTPATGEIVLVKQ